MGESLGVVVFCERLLFSGEGGQARPVDERLVRWGRRGL